MQYRTCPDCGANLDPNEPCTCHEEKEDASDAAETPSKKMLGTTVSVSNQSFDVNACEKLREVRQQTGTMAKDAALVVREVFPKFNRQLLAQCEAWDKYGIILHPDGLRAICKAYGVPVPDRQLQQVCSSEICPDVPSSGLSQCDRILRHFRDYGSITSLEAMKEYGIMRLASRISDLKQQGYVITAVTESGKNRYGEKTSYARYSLKEGPK